MKFFGFYWFFLLGFSNLLFAQIPDSTAARAPLRFSVPQLYAPLTLVGTGILTNDNSENAIKYNIVKARNKHFLDFKTHADTYLQYSPIILAYGLDIFGVPAQTDFWNRSAIFAKGELLMLGTVYSLKKITHQLRPDGSSYTSFPSGHTAQVFAAATFLSEEHRHRFKWMPYVAYGIATSVGVLRMANNEHYISDVLAGAGIGILSMKISYWTHQYKWGKGAKKLPK